MTAIPQCNHSSRHKQGQHQIDDDDDKEIDRIQCRIHKTMLSSPFLKRVSRIPMQYPVAFGMGLSCVKTSFSDLLVQKVVEKREEIDWRRNAAFGTFGLLYLGGIQYALYVPIFSRMFPGAARFAAKPIREKVKDFSGMSQLAAQVRRVAMVDTRMHTHTHTHKLSPSLSLSLLD